MQINVSDPQFQTVVFAILFFITLALSIKKFSKSSFFPTEISDELKGLAILVVVFSHIGYFLAKDTNFLFPFSILAGVGVNIFLLLSGYGLTSSSLKKGTSVFNFYYKRLRRLYLPMWLVIGTFFILDKFLLNINYSSNYIIQSFLGWFPHADLFIDIDSPLWYFSAITFYYLVFPLFFWKKFPFLSPLLIFLAGFFVLKLNLPVTEGVFNLYSLHTLAFPLGMALAVVASRPWRWMQIKERLVPWQNWLKAFALLVLIGIFVYTAINSGVGEGRVKEQFISLLTTLSAVFIFAIKDIRFRILNLVGRYSYEIYLLHWPILYRYDLFYKNLPAFLATYLYLIIFLVLGFGLQKAVSKVTSAKAHASIRLPARFGGQ